VKIFHGNRNFPGRQPLLVKCGPNAYVPALAIEPHQTTHHEVKISR
jgi:hypothetical protein